METPPQASRRRSRLGCATAVASLARHVICSERQKGSGLYFKCSAGDDFNANACNSDAPQCHASCGKAEHEPRHCSRRLNFPPRRAGKACRANRPARRSATVTNKATLALARKDQHDCGLSRDLLAMTSHNSGEAQGRLVSPRSASGGLRRGRFAPLRSAPMPHRELCDVMPSPEAGGRSRARPQNIPRCGRVTKALTAASCRPAFRSSLQAATMPAVPQCMPLHVPVQWLLTSSGEGAQPSRQPLRA
jgi:hypothetical protein